MDKYLIKRPRTTASEDVESNNEASPSVLPRNTESPISRIVEPLTNSDGIISDPGLRQRINDYPFDNRDDVRRAYISKGPCQLIGHDFPRKPYGKDMRCFRDVWFEKFDWLEYSVAKDAAYCFCCYLFQCKISGRFGSEVFVSQGFDNWKNAVERFKLHVGGVSSAHNEARVMLEGYKNQKQSVIYNMEVQWRDLEESYRTRLTAILDVTRLLLRQGMPFRGHDESASSLNMGNFREFLKFYKAKNLDILNVLDEFAPGNNQMNSPGNNHVERFLAVVHVAETSAACLKFELEELFAEHNLSLSRLRGQGYDGASNMRGELGGLKSLILYENPSAKYVHCFAHQLQLVIVRVCNTHKHVSCFFVLVRQAVNITSASCKRADKLRQLQHDRMVESVESGDMLSGRGKNQETSLARPGDTRWGSHYLTLLRLQVMWPSVKQVLENVSDDGESADAKGVAMQVMYRMDTYYFAFHLIMMKRILGMTTELSRYLQEKDQDIVHAMRSIAIVKSQLQDFRENGWDGLVEEVSMFCKANKIEVINMEDNVESRLRQKRDGQHVSCYHFYRREILFEVLDLIGAEMENRFPEITTDLLICISCLDPRDSFSRFDLQKLVHLVEHYPDDFSTFDRAILPQQLQNYIFDMRFDGEFSDIHDLQALSMKMVATKKHLVYDLVYRLIELALLLPVSTASVERVFSSMKLVKTDSRNKMADEWLNDSLVCYIEKDVFNSVKDETILQHFQEMKTRRIQLRPLTSSSVQD